MGQVNAADEVERIVAEAKVAATEAVSASAKAVEAAETKLEKAKADRTKSVKAASNILNTKELAELAGVSAGLISSWCRVPDEDEAEEPEFPGEPEAETVPLVEGAELEPAAG